MSRVGGYDERFAGYYGTDHDFRDHITHVLSISAIVNLIAFAAFMSRSPPARIALFGDARPAESACFGSSPAAS
jgi:hypothetical protein